MSDLVGWARLSGITRFPARVPGRRALRWWRPWPVAAINPGDNETSEEDDDG